MINRKVCLILTLFFLLSACSPVVDADSVPALSEDLVLSSPELIGQTFVARHGGLSAVEIWLTPLKQNADGEIILQLKEFPSSATAIHQASLPVNKMTNEAFYRFAFPAIPDSHSAYYYVAISYTGEDAALSAHTGPASTYRDGALYIDHMPVEEQLSFRLVYDPLYLLLDLIGAVPLFFVWVCYAVLLFVVPGLAVLMSFWPRKSFTYGEAIGLAIGISFAVYPLLFLFTNWLGLSLGAAYAWVPVVSGLVALVWRYRRFVIPSNLDAYKKVLHSSNFQSNLVYSVIIVLLFISRLLPIRGMTIPMWGDSVQHAAITQLFMDNNGFFETWMPYAPYSGLSIHFGFHTLSAVFAWLSRLSAPESTLVTGQLVNVGAVLALYPLALKLNYGKRWAGFVTVLTAGFVSHLPAVYVNWGRYPQLAGLAILPVAIWLVCDMMEGEKLQSAKLIITGAVIAGMTLTYYRMPYFFAVYVLVWLIVWGFSHYKNDRREFVKMIAKLIVLASLSGILLGPWVLHITTGGTLMSAMGNGMSVSGSTVLQDVLDDYQVWRDLTQYVPLLLISLFGLGFIVSIARKAWHIVALGFWTAGMALLVTARLIGLPGANMIKNFGVIISLYIPVSLMTGWLCMEAHQIITKYTTLNKWLYVVPYLGLAVWSLGKQLSVIDPSYMMVNQPDIHAMDWIRENTPNEAHFLVEGLQIYDGYSAVGTDAGWWIPLLAGRENTMPPQYAMLNEVPFDPQYTQNIVNLVDTLEDYELSSDEALHALCDHDITHIYIGQGQGQVGKGVPQLYGEQEITGNPAFALIYKQDLVRIYAFITDMCEP